MTDQPPPELDPSPSDKGAVRGRPAASCSAYVCLGCRESYEIPQGAGIRCPYCGSKERESLEVTDSDILDMLLAADAIRSEALDAPGLVEPTRDSLAEEFRRRVIYTVSLVEPNAQGMARRPNSGGQPATPTDPES